MSFGPPIRPAMKKDTRPEWVRDPKRKGLYRHRDPPHFMRYDPDAWEQAAATFEDDERTAAKQAAADEDEDNV